MTDWITSLQTDTPQEGFELAMMLARKGVTYIQPSEKVRDELKDIYANNADRLTFCKIPKVTLLISSFSYYILKQTTKGDGHMVDWPTSLQTDTPQEGFELAIMLARKGVAYT